MKKRDLFLKTNLKNIPWKQLMLSKSRSTSLHWFHGIFGIYKSQEKKILTIFTVHTLQFDCIFSVKSFIDKAVQIENSTYFDLTNFCMKLIMFPI